MVSVQVPEEIPTLACTGSGIRSLALHQFARKASPTAAAAVVVVALLTLFMDDSSTVRGDVTNNVCTQ